MLQTYQNPVYPYRRSADQDASRPAHHPVIIVGGGPAGLAAALDLALQGIATVVLDDNNTVSVGSRAVCWAKRTLEILDRYGCADRMVEKGITWNLGRVFFRDNEVYEFNLLPEKHHKMPAFINLQQYYFEEYMVDRIGEFDTIDLRWNNRVASVRAEDERTLITVETPDGPYELSCDYLLVADGANSPIREQVGLESEGQVFQDHFLIADVVMKADFPTERWFWFDPPFHPNQSALLHRQADNVFRIDFQLGWGANPDEEKKEENIIPRVRAMLGEDVEFELEWASVYTFRCRKMDDYIFKRVIFMGDAAHQVSPFGARGANGGIQSVENLAWKLARILRGAAPGALLGTYNHERQHGAAENILNSTRATDFITPKSLVSRIFRDSVLELASDYPFARSLINSGRLSMPCSYPDSPLNTPDSGDFSPAMKPGTPCLDAPVLVDGEPGWLLNHLGNRFTCLLAADGPDSARLLAEYTAGVSDLEPLVVSAPGSKGPAYGQGAVVEDREGLVAERYDLEPGSVYLIRPDQHVCARWRAPDTESIGQAMNRTLGFELE